MNPLDISWNILKTMPPGERRRVQGMERQGRNPFPKDIFSNQPEPSGYQSPNQQIANEREREALSRIPQEVTQQDFDNVYNPQVAPQPTPERVGPADMTPESIMRYTRPQLEQMIQLIHNELTRRQDNKNMGKVGVR